MRIFGVSPTLVILTLCLANQAVAGWPYICPTVEQIQSSAAKETINVSRITKDHYNYYIHDRLPQGNAEATPESWVFFMDFAASSFCDAETKIKNALKTFVFVGGPWKETENAYICKYKSSDGLIAKAMSWYYGGEYVAKGNL